MRTVSKSKKGSARARRGPKRSTRVRGENVEFRFLTQNAAALEAYAGEVLLIHGARLVAHSADMAVIKRVIRENQIESPFIYRVPAPEEKNFFF